MSGSNGNGYVPPQGTKFDCETTIIKTYVSSIDLNVLAKLRINEILEVRIGENESIVLEDGDGEILGAILHSSTADILNCIKAGASYIARIIIINTPACQVEIKRK